MSNPSADASPKRSELTVSVGSKDTGQCASPPHPCLYFLSFSCSKMCPVLVQNKLKHTWIVDFCLTLRVPFDSGLMVWDCCCCNTNWEISQADIVNTKLRRSGVQQGHRAVSRDTFPQCASAALLRMAPSRTGSVVRWATCRIQWMSIPLPRQRPKQ